MTQIKIGRKEAIVRQWLAANYESKIPLTKSIQEMYDQFRDAGVGVNVSYGLFNGVTRKVRDEIPAEIEATIQTVPVAEVSQPTEPVQAQAASGAFPVAGFLAFRDETGVVMLDLIAKVQVGGREREIQVSIGLPEEILAMNKTEK